MEISKLLIANNKMANNKNEQLNIEEIIRKEEQRNVYLSEIVRSLEEKLLKSKTKNVEEPIVVAAEIQSAQIKTINKKIQMYAQELQKMKNVKTAALAQELTTMKTQISQKEKELAQLKQDVHFIEAEVMQLTKISHARNANLDIKEEFSDKTYEVELLRKKLQRLEINDNAQLTKIPQKIKNNRSLSQTIKVADQSFKSEDKKSKIDQYALYKNLTKFYTQEEQKLKQQIQQLETKRNEQLKLSLKLKDQISSYQQKIQSLRKSKTTNETSS